MRPRDIKLAEQLNARLLSFDKEQLALLGIRDPVRRQVFIEQMLESIHRVEYISAIRKRRLSARRADPNDEIFDPLMAAILHELRGNIDEAFWLVFLSVHFGKHSQGGWRYVREVYGGRGSTHHWDWLAVSANPRGFREWLSTYQADLKRPGARGGFGNHRKYQSLDADSPTGTGAAVESYVKWVNPPRTHQELMKQASELAKGDPRKAFDVLYHSMKAVASFGRTARFDYLTMVSKLGLASIEPGSTYMQGATGPVSGARLLFANNPKATIKPADLDTWLVKLDTYLQVGMQVIEDSLCNWQKKPETFKRFRG